MSLIFARLPPTLWNASLNGDSIVTSSYKLTAFKIVGKQDRALTADVKFSPMAVTDTFCGMVRNLSLTQRSPLANSVQFSMVAACPRPDKILAAELPELATTSTS